MQSLRRSHARAVSSTRCCRDPRTHARVLHRQQNLLELTRAPTTHPHASTAPSSSVRRHPWRNPEPPINWRLPLLATITRHPHTTPRERKQGEDRPGRPLVGDRTGAPPPP